MLRPDKLRQLLNRIALLVTHAHSRARNHLFLRRYFANGGGRLLQESELALRAERDELAKGIASRTYHLEIYLFIET